MGIELYFDMKNVYAEYAVETFKQLSSSEFRKIIASLISEIWVYKIIIVRVYTKGKKTLNIYLLFDL